MRGAPKAPKAVNPKPITHVDPDRSARLRAAPVPPWQVSLVRLALAVQAGKRIDKAKVAAALAQVPDRVREAC